MSGVAAEAPTFHGQAKRLPTTMKSSSPSSITLKDVRLRHAVLKRIYKELQCYYTEQQQIQQKITTVRNDRNLVSEDGEDIKGELKRYMDVLEDSRQMVPDTSERLRKAAAELCELITNFDIANGCSSNGNYSRGGGGENKEEHEKVYEELEAARLTLNDIQMKYPDLKIDELCSNNGSTSSNGSSSSSNGDIVGNGEDDEEEI